MGRYLRVCAFTYLAVTALGCHQPVSVPEHKLRSNMDDGSVGRRLHDRDYEPMGELRIEPFEGFFWPGYKACIANILTTVVDFERAVKLTFADGDGQSVWTQVVTYDNEGEAFFVGSWPCTQQKVRNLGVLFWRSNAWDLSAVLVHVVRALDEEQVALQASDVYWLAKHLRLGSPLQSGEVVQKWGEATEDTGSMDASVRGTVRRVLRFLSEGKLPLPEWHPTGAVFVDDFLHDSLEEVEVLVETLGDRDRVGFREKPVFVKKDHSVDGFWHAWARDYGPIPITEGGKLTYLFPTSFSKKALVNKQGKHFATDGVSIDSIPFHLDLGNFMTDGFGTCYVGRYTQATETEIIGNGDGRIDQASFPTSSVGKFEDATGCHTLVALDTMTQTTHHVDEVAKLLSPQVAVVGQLVGVLYTKRIASDHAQVLAVLPQMESERLDRVASTLRSKSVQVFRVPMMLALAIDAPQEGDKEDRIFVFAVSPVNALMMNVNDVIHMVVPDYPTFYNRTNPDTVKWPVRYKLPNAESSAQGFTIDFSYARLNNSVSFDRRTVNQAWTQALKATPHTWQMHAVTAEHLSSESAGVHCAVSNLPTSVLTRP